MLDLQYVLGAATAVVIISKVLCVLLTSYHRRHVHPEFYLDHLNVEDLQDSHHKFTN